MAAAKQMRYGYVANAIRSGVIAERERVRGGAYVTVVDAIGVRARTDYYASFVLPPRFSLMRAFLPVRSRR